jgi:hypothetical protein
MDFVEDGMSDFDLIIEKIYIGEKVEMENIKLVDLEIFRLINLAFANLDEEFLEWIVNKYDVSRNELLEFCDCEFCGEECLARKMINEIFIR